MANATQSIRDRTGLAARMLAVLLVFACVAASNASPSPRGLGTPAGARTAAARPGMISGMNGWTVFVLSPSPRDQQLAAMEAAGVRVVRTDAPWAFIEPAPPGPTGHAWQFSRFDSWVAALATHRLAWQPLIDFSVWWAKTCPGFCAPTSDATYAAFAQAVAARYGAHGSFWAQHPQLPYYPARIFEIWNEENVQTFWVPPARFATLYSTARAAIHAVDPSASVIVGGLADDSQSFDAGKDYPAWYVQAMFAAQPGLRGNVDGFGLHPYGATAADVIKWTVHFRDALGALGEGTAPIDITEIGWTTGDQSQETWRAWMMNAVGQGLSRSNCGIRLVAPYDWIDPGDPGADFGLFDRKAVPPSLRPAGSAWFNALSEAASAPVLNLCGPTP